MNPKACLVLIFLSAMHGRVGSGSRSWSVYCNDGPCRQGTYWNQTLQQCEPCPGNTYLPLEDHRCIDCKPCTEPDRFNHEFVISNCTREQDTKIGCHPGWFRKRFGCDHPGECWRCSSTCRPGQVKIEDCGPDHDIICQANEKKDESKFDHTTDQSNRSAATILTWSPVLVVINILFILRL